jgi:hypothetical protein
LKLQQHRILRLRMIVAYFALSALTLFNGGCKVNYSMTGASISPDVKTIEVRYFQKTAALGPSNLSQTFTEKLKDKFLTGTSLSIINGSADLTLEGSITGYNVSPQTIQSNEIAAQNRLTISVNVKFTNLKDEKQNFESTFTRYADFPSSTNITSIEDQLVEEINTQLVDDIFNKAVINW